MPRVITDVQTTDATTDDVEMTPAIHQRLACLRVGSGALVVDAWRHPAPTTPHCPQRSRHHPARAGRRRDHQARRVYEPFRWDQFVFRPHADYQFMDAQGIFAAPGDRENTTIQQITPGILINLGPEPSLDYTATIGLYSNTNFGRY